MAVGAAGGGWRCGAHGLHFCDPLREARGERDQAGLPDARDEQVVRRHRNRGFCGLRCGCAEAEIDGLGHWDFAPFSIRGHRVVVSQQGMDRAGPPGQLSTRFDLGG